MQTLHEMLKRERADTARGSTKQEDLRGRYSKIGISAVAAAAQFNGAEDEPAPHDSADRSTARGWSRHR